MGNSHDQRDYIEATVEIDTPLLKIGGVDKTSALSATTGSNTGDNSPNTNANAYADGKVADNLTASTTVAPSKTAVNTGLATKQATLVSATNIKTINSTSLLGSGDIAIVDNATHTGEVTGATVLTMNNASVIAKVLTGYTSGAGVISATDSILQAIQKLNGNNYAPTEGTFTPTIQDLASQSNAEGQTYSVQNGKYQRIGNWVYFQLYINVTSFGTLSNELIIGGLPFTSENVAGSHNSCSSGYCSALALTAGVSVGGFISPNQAFINLTKWSATTGITTLTKADTLAASDFMLSGSYKV